MKKIIFAILSLVFCQNFVTAQSDFRIGIFGGLNYSSQKASSPILENSDGSFVHFLYGFSGEYAINEKFSLKTGLGVEKRRFDFFAQSYTIEVTPSQEFIWKKIEVANKNEYKFLTIPLVVKYNFGKENSFFVTCGAYMSLVLNQDHSTKFTPTNVVLEPLQPGERIDYLLRTELNDNEYGISLGFGKSFNITKKSKISFELRNNYGFENQVSYNVYNDGKSDFKTNTINLMTEFSFGL